MCSLSSGRCGQSYHRLAAFLRDAKVDDAASAYTRIFNISSQLILMLTFSLLAGSAIGVPLVSQLCLSKRYNGWTAKEDARCWVVGEWKRLDELRKNKREKTLIGLLDGQDYNGYPSLDRATNIERVTRMLTHGDNRWCQAEGYHRLRHLRQPSKPLCRRCPRCHLQHLPPHQGPDLLLAASHAGRLLPAELGHREVRLSNCYEEKLYLTLEIETTT